MNKSFFIYFYLGSLLLSIMYGSAFMLPIYMKMLNGNELNMGHFLIYMGIGALFSVISLNKPLLRYLAPLYVVIIGTVAYSLGLLALCAINHISDTYVLGFIMGIGWGLIYVASIIALSENTLAIYKKYHFSYFAAINALGAGVAPVIFHFLSQYSVNLKEMYFFEGAIISLISLILLMFAEGRSVRVGTEEQQKVHTSHTLFSRSQIVSLYTIFLAFLSACIFTTLTFFQIIFAEINHVNYAMFFTLITASIIVSRLVLIHWVSAYNNMLFYLSLMMTFSIFLFLFIDNYHPIYILSALLFGLSYGLIFPLIQTISLANANAELHHTIITYFVIAYFIGIFGFPLISASIILYLNHTMIIAILLMIAILYTVLSAITLRESNKSIIIGANHS